MLDLPEKKVRNVVQIVSHEGFLHRLCDDGTIWYLNDAVWVRCQNVPQGDK